MRDLIVRKNRKRLSIPSTPRRGLWALRYLALRRKSNATIKSDAAFTNALRTADDEYRQMYFTQAIIALSAKLAMADGQMKREYYLGFRDAFPLTGGLCMSLRKLFDKACADKTSMEHYILQVKNAFPRNEMLYKALVERMFIIATARPPMSRAREHFLAKLAHQLGISPADYSAIHERYTLRKPHHVMGTKRRPSKDVLKKRYHQLMQRYHPDKYAGEFMSPEVAQILSLRTAEIGAAYKALSRKAA